MYLSASPGLPETRNGVSVRIIEHEMKADRMCACGARFKSRSDLRKHIAQYSDEQVGIGFAPHAPDFKQKKKPKKQKRRHGS